MKRLKRLYRVLRSFLPSQLPQSGSAMDAFIQEVLELAEVPDNSSFRVAVCTQLMHVSPDRDSKSKRAFVIALRKAISNQLAYQVIQQEKARKDEQSVQDESL